METINGDLSRRATVDTAALDWASSPSGTVWRKRVHLVGPAESGQVTSVVRYEAQSAFPRHNHPDGEEIFVLDGVFSDEHGDWPAGTYLLNPEGFSHAPFSREGCVLFVKLRQYPGLGREHVAVQTGTLPWADGPVPGIERKQLYAQPGFSDRTALERWAADSEMSERRYDEGAEIFVLGGTLEDDEGRYGAGTWLRFPAGAAHRPRSAEGCELYLKTGGLAYLQSG